jgi:alkanesulfonate monooxygenase SsuD/methylene tetrahydromethanopterin reductase-like flavin-dependent oxidoreductase (luciferase family)
MDLDSRGIPGGFIASAEFEEAANAQAAAFGFEPAVTYVRHPIQDRTDDEMREIADSAFEKVLEMICTSN